MAEESGSAPDNAPQTVLEVYAESAPAPLKAASTKRENKPQSSAINKKSTHSSKERSPNFFLGVRIQSESILAKLLRIQQEFCAQNPEIKKCLIPTSKFHITLFVLYIESNQQMATANQILEDSRDLLAEFYQQTKAELHLTGIGQFNGNTVIYSGLGDDSSTSKFQDLVSRLYHRFLSAEPSLVIKQDVPLESISKRGYQSKSIWTNPPSEVSPWVAADELPMSLLAFAHRPEEPGPQWSWTEHRAVISKVSARKSVHGQLRTFEFTPHVTLFKARGPKERKIMKEHFIADKYAHLQEEHHGVEQLQSIDLLEMRGSSDGFYERYSSMLFALSNSTNATSFLHRARTTSPRLK